MNNPISRMPNPMAPMGQVPPIPPMGANPTAQNPSAMPLPVVNQPTVDMQMMGTTANQRKKFNDLMESLSAPRQPMTQAFKRGGQVQYLNNGGSAMMRYAKGGGVGRMREAKLRRLDPLAENRLGANEEAAARSRAIQSKIDKLTKGSTAGYYYTPPNKKAVNDPKVAYDMGVKSTYDSYPIVMPNDPGYDKARGLQHGNFSLPGVYNSLMGLHDMVIPDFITDPEGMMTFKDRMLQPESTLAPTTTNRNLLGVALDAANPIAALGGVASEPINTLLDKTGINSVIGNAISNLDLEDVTNVLNPVGYAMDKAGDYLGYANGGPVQYFANGGSPKPSYGKYSYAKQPKIKKFDTSTNEDTTIPNTVSKISNFFSNLFSGGKSTDTGYGDLSDPKSSFPGSDLNYHDHLSNLAKERSNKVPKINMDILDMPAPMDVTLPPKVISNVSRNTGYGDLTKLGSAFPGSDLNFSEPLQIPTVENIETQNKFPEQNVRLNMPRQNLIPSAASIPDILYDDRLDFSTASGINDVAPPVSPLNIGQYDIVQGMNEADKVFSPLPISPRRGPFDDDFGRVDRISPDRGPFDNEFGNVNQIMGPEDFAPYPDVSDVFKTSTPPARPENISQIAENIAAQSGQTNQQGFGIGQFLPLILGMFNPKLGMALGIMQAMGGKGEGEGEGLLGGILPNLAKTLGIGDKERTFNIGGKDFKFTATDPEDETFLANQASNERERARREMQENIDAITKPTVPDPILGEDGSYSCPLPYVYDPNTKMCVMMEAGLGGQGAAANEPKAPIAMQMGGQVNPSLNNAVDNFLQALA